MPLPKTIPVFSAESSNRPIAVTSSVAKTTKSHVTNASTSVLVRPSSQISLVENVVILQRALFHSSLEIIETPEKSTNNIIVTYSLTRVNSLILILTIILIKKCYQKLCTMGYFIAQKHRIAADLFWHAKHSMLA
jgi:hypothetical protein